VHCCRKQSAACAYGQVAKEIVTQVVFDIKTRAVQPQGRSSTHTHTHTHTQTHTHTHTLFVGARLAVICQESHQIHLGRLFPSPHRCITLSICGSQRRCVSLTLMMHVDSTTTAS